MIKNNCLGITLGDPSGIGPEIVAKSLHFLNRINVNINFKVIGSKSAYIKACKISNINTDLENIEEFIDFDKKINFDNKPSSIGGEVSYKAICKAAELYKNRKIDAIVTAPISKESLHLAGHNYDGHTGLLGSLFNITEPYLMLANKRFSTLHITCHKPLKEALELIKKDRLIKAIEIGHDHIYKMKNIKPKIAVCGLNPHASENGIFGSEENEEILPAINYLLNKNIDIVGPISSDIIFRNAVKGMYDLVIANYHDQGHIPVKLLYFNQSVNLTLGVPFIRTSVDHGTAFDIAYKNQAKSTNMVTSILYALKMSN